MCIRDSFHVVRRNKVVKFSIYFQADDHRDAGGRKKSRVNRKHVILAATCAVVVAMVIAGVLMGMKFHLDSTSDIVTVGIAVLTCMQNKEIFCKMYILGRLSHLSR